MSRIKCFWLEPLKQVEVNLVRYSSTELCPCKDDNGCHEARVAIGHEPDQEDAIEKYPRFDPLHPLWPTHCTCGYQFTEDDHKMRTFTQLYMRADTAELMTLKNAPVGAMFDAEWMKSNHLYTPVDGICLMVRTPGGDWPVDGPVAKDGRMVKGGWERHGTVRDVSPTVTARPSIVARDYHGWLTHGHLEDA